MTLLSIAREMSVDVAEASPDTVQDAEPFSRMAVQFINETGRELARRVDWHVLRRTYTASGDGTATSFTITPGFARLSSGLCASADGVPVRGSLSADEWSALSLSSFGVPRYFFAVNGVISFYPNPAAGQAVDVIYQTSDWAQGANGNGKSSMDSDGDVERIPSDLLVKGAVWRWLRHAGRNYSDHMAEYEAAIADLVKAGNGERQP